MSYVDKIMKEIEEIEKASIEFARWNTEAALAIFDCSTEGYEDRQVRFTSIDRKEAILVS